MLRIREGPVRITLSLLWMGIQPFEINKTFSISAKLFCNSIFVGPVES